MLNKSDGQNLIEAFFDALRLRHLDQCQAHLSSLEALSQQQPSFKPWRLYLKGILAFEVEHNWAKAEQIFSKLCQTDLEPALHERVLYALGRSFDIQGRWKEAIAAFEQIVELGQTIEKAKAWKHIAISYCKGFDQGDFGPAVLQQAIENCHLAFAALESIADSTPDAAWLEGSVWNTLGLIHRNLGQWDRAVACYQRDLTICRSLNDHYGIGLSYLNLGEIYQKRGQASWPDALEAYQQALDLTHEFDDPYYETEALANLGFLHQEMGKSEPALNYYRQAIEIIEDLRARISTEEARAGFFATIVDTYANTILLCLETGREAQAFDYVEQARSRAFLDLLVAHSPALSQELEARPITLAEVQTALPDDALLLEYFTTGLEEVRLGQAASRQGIQRHRFPPAKTLIFAVTRDQIQIHDTGLSPNDLRPRRLKRIVERHFLEPQIRRELYDRLIAPLKELLQGKRRLYLAPHGPLHYIPFQTLIAPDGETLLCAKGPQLIYAPSATLLFRLGQAPLGQASDSCLALGYNSEGERALRFAEEEARSIARLTRGQYLTGPSAKKAKLYDQAANYRLLHFSCHGDFDPKSPLSSALQIGLNEALTAQDIFEGLRLRCDLVILSVCDSGLSQVRRGDELIGLMRAFMYAGAPARRRWSVRCGAWTSAQPGY